MEKTYQLEGMSCGNCVKHVKQALQETPGVENAEVQLQPQMALLTLSKTVDLKDLQTQLDNAGNYTIKEFIENK